MTAPPLLGARCLWMDALPGPSLYLRVEPAVRQDCGPGRGCIGVGDIHLHIHCGDLGCGRLDRLPIIAPEGALQCRDFPDSRWGWELLRGGPARSRAGSDETALPRPFRMLPTFHCRVSSDAVKGSMIPAFPASRIEQDGLQQGRPIHGRTDHQTHAIGGTGVSARLRVARGAVECAVG
ncbi:hypothetical protein D3C81_1596590 [compost metagenome]